MDKPWLIQSFYTSNIRQDFLPVFYDSERKAIVSRRRAGKDADSQKPREQGLREVLHQAAPDGKQIRDWTPAEMVHFCKDQWEFLSPIFDSHVFSYKFPRKMPLPYANCVVHRCIHSGHLKLSPGEVKYPLPSAECRSTQLYYLIKWLTELYSRLSAKTTGRISESQLKNFL